jgi:hypothetical protein
MFVRQSQLTLLDDSGTPISDTSPSPGASTATTPDDGGKSRSRLSRCVNISLFISWQCVYMCLRFLIVVLCFVSVYQIKK